MVVVLFFLLLTSVPAFSSEPDADSGPGVLHRIVAYVPNRVLDVLDVVRLRVPGRHHRIGPGRGSNRTNRPRGGVVFLGSA